MTKTKTHVVNGYVIRRYWSAAAGWRWVVASNWMHSFSEARAYALRHPTRSVDPRDLVGELAPSARKAREAASVHVESWGCDCEKCDEPIQALLQKWREASFRNPHDVTYERFANELEEALNG